MVMRKIPNPAKTLMLKALPPLPGMKRVWTGTSYAYELKTSKELIQDRIKASRRR